MLPNVKKDNTLTLHVIHFPLLAIALLLIGGLTVLKISSYDENTVIAQESYVLGTDDYMDSSDSESESTEGESASKKESVTSVSTESVESAESAESALSNISAESEVSKDSESMDKMMKVDSMDKMLKIEPVDDGFEFSKNGVGAETDLGVDIDSDIGVITVETDVGNVILEETPDSVVEKAQDIAKLSTVESVELVTSEDTGDLEYKVTGVRKEKFLGIFTVELDETLIYNVADGDFLTAESSTFTKILDFLSF